ncbi:MAG: hypothetical protein AAFN92_21270 [Bacteroidota bacterium]
MRKYWNRFQAIDANRILALAAVFVSVCALYVSIQEMRLMRQQQKVSFYPHLALGRHYSEEGFSLYIKNSGTGLALVNSVQLTNGERYFTDWPEVIAHYMPDSLAFGYDHLSSSTINEEVLTPGEEVRLFAVKWRPGVREFEEEARELTMRICYSSLLDDHWVLENETRWQEEQACVKVPEKEFY